MDQNFLRLRLVWRDEGMIEIESTVSSGSWRATSTSYGSPPGLIEDARALAVWATAPEKPMVLEVGADSGSGWLWLEFYTVDAAKHVECHVQLASRDSVSRVVGVCRKVSVRLRTEAGLIIRFANELEKVALEHGLEAELEGMAL